MNAIKKQGFTLLEMSIVLLIIALVAGGVVYGRSLIRASELRAVVQEYDLYTRVVKEFQDKYLQLPGDMTNATTLWGSDNNGGVNPCPYNAYLAAIPTSTRNTCDGNGDGKIGNCANDLSGAACTTTNVNEVWRVWQHLKNAGLIEGSYTGRTGGTSSDTQATPGLNVPASKLRPAGWTLLYYLNTTTAPPPPWLGADHYGHVFLLGGGQGSYSGKFTTQPVIPVLDAYGLDLKIDDGNPLSGFVRAWVNYWLPTSDNGPTAGASASSYCVKGTSYYTPDGTHSDKEFTCSLIFMPGF
jgi:prepilin-type N-terminal cleavage/methylation domain-containing protein